MTSKCVLWNSVRIQVFSLTASHRYGLNKRSFPIILLAKYSNRSPRVKKHYIISILPWNFWPQKFILKKLSWNFILKILSWNFILKLYLEILSWNFVLKYYPEILCWNLILKSYLVILSWNIILKFCLEILSWNFVLKYYLEIFEDLEK